MIFSRCVTRARGCAQCAAGHARAHRAQPLSRAHHRLVQATRAGSLEPCSPDKIHALCLCRKLSLQTHTRNLYCYLARSEQDASSIRGQLKAFVNGVRRQERHSCAYGQLAPGSRQACRTVRFMGVFIQSFVFIRRLGTRLGECTVLVKPNRGCLLLRALVKC